MTSNESNRDNNNPTINMNSPIPNLAYSNQVCFNCYRSPPQTTKLSNCGSCKRVKYCSTDCSKADWQSHKSFCRAFTSLRSRPTALLPPLHNTPQGILNRRQTHVSQQFLEVDLLNAGLNREANKLECLLLYRENRCWICFDREEEARERGVEMVVCKGCRIACFCKDHEEEGKIFHREEKMTLDGTTQCQLYNLSNEILEFHLRHTSSTSLPPSLFIPPRILQSSDNPLPSTWINYFLSVQLPTPTPSNAEVFGVFAESLSPILTIVQSLQSLQSLSLHSSKTLRLEIIGATVGYEGSFLPCFEEILHLFPTLENLSIVFIGEEVPITLEATHTETFLATCENCTKGERKVGFEWRSGDYKELVELKELKEEVDLVVIFSSGVGLEDWEDEIGERGFNSWKKTFEGLWKRKEIPILMVANTKEEIKDDFKILDSLNLKLGGSRKLGKMEKNVWCGGDVHVDVFEKGGMWRRNEWTFVIEGDGSKK